MAFYDEKRHGFVPGTTVTRRNGVLTEEKTSEPAIEWAGTTLADALDLIGSLYGGDVCVGDLDWRMPDPWTDGVPKPVFIRRDLTFTFTPTYPTVAYYHVYQGKGVLVGALVLPDRTEPPADVRARWESIVEEVRLAREARGGQDLAPSSGWMMYAPITSGYRTKASE